MRKFSLVHVKLIYYVEYKYYFFGKTIFPFLRKDLPHVNFEK